MIAWLAALVTVLVPVLLPAQTERLGAAGDAPTCRLVVPTEAHAVGEPFEIELVCEHDPSYEVRAADEVADVLTLDAGWLVLDTTAVPDAKADGDVHRVHGYDDAKLVTRVVYRVASLGQEPSDGEDGVDWSPERPLVGLGVRATRGDESIFVEAPPASVLVESVLRPDDDAPRPLPPPMPSESHGGSVEWRRAAWIAGIASLVFVLAVATALRGNRVGAAPLPPPTRAERLERLRADVAAGRADVRAATFEAVAIVRASLAERGAERDPSAIDGEWVAGLPDDALASGERERLERLLERSESLRFAPHLPTRWAVEDVLAEAQRVEEETARRAAPTSEHARG
ncbi:MAG: hypothetical protein R3F34_18425 [Planctomycetota bacterium]